MIEIYNYDDEDEKTEKSNKNHKTSTKKVVNKIKNGTKKNKAIKKFILANIVSILITIGIIILIIFLTGIILFFITMPGMMLGKIDDWGREMLGNIQGIFTGDSTTASISAEEVVNLAEHLERMGYDVQAYGLGTVKYKDDGKTTSLRNGKSQEIEEITKNVEGKEYLRSYIAANENTYVLSQYSIYGAITSEIHNLGEVFKLDKDGVIKKAKDESTGMIDIVGNSDDLLNTSNSSFVDVNRDTKQLKIYSEAINLGSILGTAKRIFTGNPDIKWGEAFSYDLNNWVGRYGRPTELSLALHLSTMMPDLPYEIATGDDFNTKVRMGLMDIDVVYDVTAVKGSNTITSEEIENYYEKYCKNEKKGTIPGTKWEREEISELKEIIDGGTAEPVDMDHAQKCGDFVWDGHNSRIWHEWHDGTAPGDINAYTQAINILWNEDYRTCDVYDVLIENEPKWKTETSLFFFENEETNNHFKVKSEVIDRTVESIKNALDSGSVVATISDANAFRDNNGNHKEWTGAHWGVIFMFDGTYFHMKGGGSGHISNGLYTPKQLEDWLKVDTIGTNWRKARAISRSTQTGIQIKWPFIASVEKHWYYNDIDFTKGVYRFAKSATKEIDYKPEDENNILNKNNISVKLDANLSSRQGVIYQVAEPEATGPNKYIKKLFQKDYYKYDGTTETAKKIENAKAVEVGSSTYKFNGEEIPTDVSASNDVKKEKVDFKENKVESLVAFGILQNMHTEASDYIYRNLKELMVNLKYFSTDDFTENVKQILLWPVKTSNQNSKWETVKDVNGFGTTIKCEDPETEVVSPSEAKVEKISKNEITLEFTTMGDESYDILDYIVKCKDPYKKVDRELLNGMKINIKGIEIDRAIKEGQQLNRGDLLGIAIGNTDEKSSITITMYNLDKSIVEDMNEFFNQEENTRYEELMKIKKEAPENYDEGLDITQFLNSMNKDNLSILFIGNSKTFFNDYPGQVNGLIGAAGKKAHIDSATMGGRTFLQLYEIDEIRSKISSRKWDYIVLQEATDASLNEAEILPGAKSLVKYARTHSNPYVNVVYNATWVLSYDEDPDYVSRYSKALSNFEIAASTPESKGDIAYTAAAFMKYHDMHPSTANSDMFCDERHPTEIGSYLAACCTYNAIYEKSPVGLKYYDAHGVKLSKEKATELQKIAESVQKGKNKK